MVKMSTNSVWYIIIDPKLTRMQRAHDSISLICITSYSNTSKQ